MALGQRRRAAQVCDLHERVGGGLDEEGLRPRAYGRFHARAIAHVDVFEDKPEGARHLLDEAVGAAVEVVRAQNSVPRPKEAQGGRDGSHPRSEGNGACTFLQFREDLLESAALTANAVRIPPTARSPRGTAGWTGRLPGSPVMCRIPASPR